MPENSRWYALVVRYQRERQTEKALQSKGLETLVPLYRTQRQWSDRVQALDLPLFAGYVLCRFALEKKIHVLDTLGVTSVVGFGGAAAALEDPDIAAIRTLVASKRPLAPWPYLKTGDRVRVERGPLRSDDPGRFVGRIWIEDEGDSVVRFNGTYRAAAVKHAPPTRYFHFDSWRVNAAPDLWVPAQIYVEEEGSAIENRPSVPRFKAQTRFWGYTAASTRAADELTSILVESSSQVEDQIAPKDVSPIESQRSWERQAEDNVIARLETAGLLAPPGPVDTMLDSVVNNLIISASLNVDARCRVLLTTPLETFSIGHTIVISRGLIDVLPDEASLALLLADELSHIALGHRTPTQFAFRNQTMLSDTELLQRVHFKRTPAELEAAGKKTMEIMRASPYKNIGSAGLFLKALARRGNILPWLLNANWGNQLANAGALERLTEFTRSAPELDETQMDQIAALPLGSRVKVDPWSNRLALVKARPLELLSPREKMPFEIAPVTLYLTRLP